LLLAIPIQQFRDLIQDDLKLGNKLLWNVLRQLARHMEHMNERIVDEGYAKTLELRAITKEDLHKLHNSDD
jgi:CRP-like cAMP-binding protein